MSDKFECALCKDATCDELWSFGNFGNNKIKIVDQSFYCELCFEKKAEEYEES